MVDEIKEEVDRIKNLLASDPYITMEIDVSKGGMRFNGPMSVIESDSFRELWGCFMEYTDAVSFTDAPENQKPKGDRKGYT